MVVIVAVLAVGIASVLLYRLPWSPLVKNFLTIVLWTVLGAELAGPVDLSRHQKQEREIAAALRERSAKLAEGRRPLDKPDDEGVAVSERAPRMRESPPALRVPESTTG